jgi:hypothetical protein
VTSDRFGVGAQVHVRDASPADAASWTGEPSGIILRSGGSAISGVWGSAERGRQWWIEFDEPQTDATGAPHGGAQIAEKYLELAPPWDENR